MTPHTDPSWDIKGCYITQIKGDPCIYNKHMIFPKTGGRSLQPGQLRVHRHDRHRDACAQRDQVGRRRAAGLLTSADLPLRGFAGRFKLN